jgi:hypothetical protein
LALPATFDSLTIRARCSLVELKRSLDAPQPQDRDTEIDARFRPKFAECLPEHQLARFACERLYDWAAASQIQEGRIIHDQARD